MPSLPPSLPIDPELPRIAKDLARHGRLILTAPPGAGKTTRVPPALLDHLSPSGQIVLVQPRRIAAQSVARRIADERGGELGGEVGYQVRFDNRSRSETRLRVVTEGILLRELQRDPFLEKVSVVLLDEFHERSLNGDLLLGLLREVAGSRDDLRLVLMSATLNTEELRSFLGDPPVIDIPGKPYPVETDYRPRPGSLPLEEHAARVVLDTLTEQEGGDLLVFLPGLFSLRSVRDRIGEPDGVEVHLLHGSLPLADQQRALRPSSLRKIILSTNIAETSLTIDGVDRVIDSGLARVLRHDPATGIDRLVTERASRFSAIQRAGRAGRLGPGRAIRLYSEADLARLDEQPTPEVRRVDLASAVLELRAWGIQDAATFGWLEPPGEPALARAEELLVRLGAVEEPRGALTETGKRLLRFPVHPRLARLLVGAATPAEARAVCGLAALIEERDIVSRATLERDPRATTSDLLDRLDRLDAAERDGFSAASLRRLGLEPGPVRNVRRIRDQLLRMMPKPLRDGATGGVEEERLLRLLLPAYPDRVARRRAPRAERARLVGGRGLRVLPLSGVKDGEFLLAHTLDESIREERLEARATRVSRIERSWIEEEFPAEIRDRVEVFFDEEREVVRARILRAYLDLPLEDGRERKPTAREAEPILREIVTQRADDLVDSREELAAWLRRVRCLREWRPDLDLPDLDGPERNAVLAQACRGKTGLAEIRAAGLLPLFQARLPYEQIRAVAELAPETITVPTGSKIRLEYEPGKPPVLPVRIQEMFGLARTPTVAGGRVPVLLHLLGPNFRPVQVTQDLESFWSTTYAQVRKDLRGRYPKHHWPEDPWSAEPTRGTKKRRPPG